GNLINAVVHRSHHASVGFSTAIFGIVGTLGALAFMRRRLGAQRVRAWIGIAAALGLLAMLGADKETDMLAHLFGFASGTAAGIAAWWIMHRWIMHRPPLRSAIVQTALAVLALAGLAGSWLIAGVARF